MIRTSLLLLAIGLALPLAAQRGPVRDLPLEDFSQFQTQPANWTLLGGVLMHPEKDPREPAVTSQAPEPEVTKNKRRRRRKKSRQAAPPPPPPPPPIREQPGTGILLNRNDQDKNGHLVTHWEHGDIILDLEVMVPKGSNSGIYLQGRYEIQILDSWGKALPTFADMGGIFRNRDYPPDQSYPGKPPARNAAKAPGLWQRLVIAFRAPRFNSEGEKIENARFVSVDLNGVRIHENIEVPTPTRAAMSREEVARGPLLIQGDHGPVAFRNIRYQLLEEQPVQLTGLSYEIYEGRFASAEEVAADSAVAVGALEQLSFAPAEGYNAFGMIWRGKLEVPVAGTYDFQISRQGGAALRIGGQTFDFPRTYQNKDTLRVDLAAGAHDFELVYYRQQAHIPARLGLFNITSHPVALHTEAMFAPLPGNPPILVTAGARPRLLRAFYDFEGDRDRRLTHTIGVGGPQGVNFIYDLKAGNLVGMWRGPFVDATPMWRDRGDGSFRPLGPVRGLFRGHSFAYLPDSAAAFPADLREADGFRNIGYQLDPASGYPTFLYQIDSVEVRDRIVPDEQGKGLIRHLEVKGGPADRPLTLKLAEGADIRVLEDGWYSIDQAYYLQLPAGRSAVIRSRADRRELILTLNSDLSYTINW